MKKYKDLLADGLQDRYQEILERPVNQEDFSKDFFVAERSRDKATHEECQRLLRLKGMPRLSPFEYVEPVTLREYNTALLCKFVDEHEHGQGIAPATLEFLYHIIVDVLEGEELDVALPLLRELRPVPAKGARELANKKTDGKKYEVARAIFTALRNGQYKTIASAAEVIGPLWNITKETAEQYYKKLRRQIEAELSSDRRSEADT